MSLENKGRVGVYHSPVKWNLVLVALRHRVENTTVDLVREEYLKLMRETLVQLPDEFILREFRNFVDNGGRREI